MKNDAEVFRLREEIVDMPSLFRYYKIRTDTLLF